jgi:hypothetical protein
MPFEIFSRTLYNKTGVDPVIAWGTESCGPTGEVKWVRENIERDGEHRGVYGVARTPVG